MEWEREVVRVNAFERIRKLRDRIHHHSFSLSLSFFCPSSTRDRRRKNETCRENLRERMTVCSCWNGYKVRMAWMYTPMLTLSPTHYICFSCCLFEPTCTHAQIHKVAHSHLIENLEERKREWNRETKKEGMLQYKMHEHACISRVHGMHASVYELVREVWESSCVCKSFCV